MKLDDKAIQKMLREVDGVDLCKILKGANEAVKKKIFRNMSKRASQMLKEDMEFMGSIRITEVTESQEKILTIISQLEQRGEIVIYYDQEFVK
jgi:flagellar motor switch protein FliG